jgi:UDP-N-acetylmuramyl pentapeptide phosphotransferase/UDP-N-acetylglucosamine-1-phosphate transferase
MYALMLSFITAFILTYSIIPVIIRVVKERGIFDNPNSRSSHKEPTPSLGGVGLFAGTVCAIVLWTPVQSFWMLQYLLAPFVLIFLLGILDDLAPISPAKKFTAQLLVSVIIVYKANTQITSLYGVFGIEKIPELTGFIFSVIIIVGVINSFNLRDGINGLAGSIGLLNCLIFGTWFFVVGAQAFSMLAFSLAGSIIAFLKYNFTPARIFMGDTGSLLIGTVCSVLGINFIEISHKLTPESPFLMHGTPAIVIAVLILPIYDTFSSFIRRMSQGKSPFYPDHDHIHHKFLRLGFTHTQTTLSLIAINVVFVVTIASLHFLGTEKLLGLELVMSLALSLALSVIKNKSVPI